MRKLSFAALAALLTLSIANPSQSASEGELRAAMLYNIARFVHWPTSALKGAHVFTVCSVGHDEVTDSLALLSGKSIHNLPVALLELKRDADLPGCRVIYIAREQSLRTAAIAQQLQVSHIAALTVSDAPSFLVNGGMVQLLTLDNRLRFRIHQRSAEKSGLSINAKLLQLALNGEDD